MNLAFPAICILILALPGIILRKAFARAAVPFSLPKGDKKSPGQVGNKYPVSVRPIFEEVSLSIIWSVILHVFWLWVANLIGAAEPNYWKVIRIIHGSSNIDAQGYGDALDYLASHRESMVIYFLSLYAFSFLIGRFALLAVRAWKLDHKFFIFRLEDHWFYFLRGEVFDFVEFERFVPQPRPQICGTYVSVVLAQTGQDYLYKGFLWDFHLDNSGNLDRIVLHHVIRSPFNPHETEEEKALDELEAGQAKKKRIEKTLIGSSNFTFQTVTMRVPRFDGQ